MSTVIQLSKSTVEVSTRPRSTIVVRTAVTGPRGLTGPAGADGADGADGQDGADGATGAQGPQGIQGVQGPQGPQGPAGDAGANGSDGAPGDSAYEVAVANGFVGTEVEWLESLVGPQGPQGVQGATGATGAAGATGATGPQGPTGAAGADGSDGADGAAGADGSVWRDGTGAPSNGLGANGDFYLNDANGDVYQKASGTYSVVANIRGPQGIQGGPGADGADGADGATGAAGTNGADGSPGSVLRNGAGAPSNGLGINGDYYLNDTNGDLYEKAAGAYSVVANLKGPQGDAGADGAGGADGATGAAGADGKTILNGTGAPDSGLGVNGDFYIDTAADAIYGPKTAGAWGSATSLVGPAGADGADGADADLGTPTGTGELVRATSPTFTQKFGIGAAHNAGWGSSLAVIDLNSHGAISQGGSLTGPDVGLSLSINAYKASSGPENTSWKYKTAAAAQRYVQKLGQHLFQSAASGSADDAITWTTQFTIDTSNNWFGTAGNAAMTTGFVLIPAASGPPSGTPTITAGYAPLYYDRTAKILYSWNTDNSAWENVAAAQPASTRVFYPGVPSASALMFLFTADFAMDFAAAIAGSQGKALTAATAQTDIDVRKNATTSSNGTSVGTIRFAAAGTVPTFIAASPFSLAIGDTLSGWAPASPDATLADISVSLYATR